MLIKDALFYMANAHPEIGRMADAEQEGDLRRANNARMRILDIIDCILSFDTISFAAREEWSAVRNLIQAYEMLSIFEQSIVKNYAEPFAFKFMRKLECGAL
ncbi:MAG: hypothetical protein HYS59_01720 [Candidatus Vogelbacteria bacterium]|nr:hypothetical protein [Candidatus Vogelbacteria bacterium]